MKRFYFYFLILAFTGLSKPGCDLFSGNQPENNDTNIVKELAPKAATPALATPETCLDQPGWRQMGYRNMEHCMRIAMGDLNEKPGRSVTDIDGNSYRIVQIGEQSWMAENLRVTRYRDGSRINAADVNGEWQLAAHGTYSIYPFEELEGLNSDAEVAAAYGLLYDLHAVRDSRGLCPEGWSVPTERDWMELQIHLKESHLDVYRGNMGGMLKSPRQVGSPLGDHWATLNHPRWDWSIHIGRDDFGFSGLPAGFVNCEGVFQGAGSSAIWWSTSACAAALPQNFSLSKMCSRCYNSNQCEHLAKAVRCIKNQ